MIYENLQYSDAVLPLVFRDDLLTPKINMCVHWHEAVEMVLIVQGQVMVTNNTHTVVARRGQVVCIHAGHLHKYHAVGGNCRYYCIIFPKTALPSTELYKSPLPFITRDGTAVRLFEALIETLEQKNRFYAEAGRGILAQLYVTLALLCGEETIDKDRRVNEIVKSAIEYIEYNFAQTLTVKSIARAVGVSEGRLCHIFKEITGETLSNYWQRFRCEKAKEMLSRGSSVAMTSERCGFSSQGYFTRVYKKQFGALPSRDKERL